MVSSLHTQYKNANDRELERRVAHALLGLRLPRFQFLHLQAEQGLVTRLRFPGFRFVQIDAIGGLVTLSGQVPTVAEKRVLNELVPRVPGVIEVDDQVEVVEVHLRRRFTLPA